MVKESAFVYSLLVLIIFNTTSNQDKEFVNTANMVKLIANANNHRIFMSRFLNLFVVIGKKCPGKIGRLFNKVFGDLYYDKSMSEYKENYRKFDLKSSIELTEK